MINKKNLLAILLLLSISVSGLTYTFADNTTTDNTKTFKSNGFGGGMGKGMGENMGMGGGMGNGIYENLTDEEKETYKYMTTDERKTFMETKQTEQQTKMEARETVIDKLLAGTDLTSDEETIRAEIIKERAERKVEMETRKAEMDAIKVIMEKKENGETLTDDEQTKLDNFDSNRGGHGEGRR